MLQQFKSIPDLLAAFPTEWHCINHLEQVRWNGKPVSPFSPKSKVCTCKNNTYKCVDTNRNFNVRTMTIFDGTRIPLQKWFLALYIFSSHKKGISSHQLAKDITITQKSAWYMLHRIRFAFDHPAFNAPLVDEIEIDETFIGGSISNKHKNKKPLFYGTAINDKATVMGILERKGNVKGKVLQAREKNEMLPFIYDNVTEKSNVYTDEFSGYNDLKNNYNHSTVLHGAKEYVRGNTHVNGIEGFWSHLKRGIDGIYHWVSKEHLQAYVNEFSLRHNTRTDTTENRFNFVILGVGGKKLPYKILIDNARPKINKGKPRKQKEQR